MDTLQADLKERRKRMSCVSSQLVGVGRKFLQYSGMFKNRFKIMEIQASDFLASFQSLNSQKRFFVAGSA